MSIRRSLSSLMLCVFASTACSQASARDRHSILEARGDTIVLLLLDAASAKPMARVAVKVYSDNGIVCRMAPCPTNGISWKSSTDNEGKIHLPRRVLQYSMSATAAEHDGDLARDAYEDPNGRWTLDMLPSDTSNADKRPIKLIDARSGRPVANQIVRIDYRTPLSARDTMTLTSSGLGYIFIPITGVAGDFEDVWAASPGYRRTRIDFSGPDGRTTRMRPESSSSRHSISM